MGSRFLRVVDNDIDTTVVINGSLNNLLAFLNRVIVGHSLAAQSLDLCNHLVGSGRGPTSTTNRGTKIIDNNLEGSEIIRQPWHRAIQTKGHMSDRGHHRHP